MALGPAPARDPAAAPDLTRLKIARGEGLPARRRAGRAVAAALVLLLALGAWAYATGRVSFEGAAGAPVVATARVAVPAGGGPPEAEVKGNGYVIARKRAALSTVLSGRIVELNAEEGTTVRKGQVVARIQHDDYDSALVSAERDVAVARARRDEQSSSLAASRLDRKRLEGENAVLSDLVRQAQADADRAAAEERRKDDLH